jgi:hypothetical protein
MLSSIKFQNGTQIQDGRQNFFIVQICVFNNFFKLLQDYLILSNCSSVHLIQKRFFLKNSKWLKNSLCQFFCTKIRDFWVAELLNEMF